MVRIDLRQYSAERREFYTMIKTACRDSDRECYEQRFQRLTRQLQTIPDEHLAFYAQWFREQRISDPRKKLQTLCMLLAPEDVKN